MLKNVMLIDEVDVSGAVILGGYDGKYRVIGEISRKSIDDIDPSCETVHDRVAYVRNNFQEFLNRFQVQYDNGEFTEMVWNGCFIRRVSVRT
jgi:hypothetical protein